MKRMSFSFFSSARFCHALAAGCICFFSVNTLLSAQTKDTAKQERAKPLELPEFVIEGKAELDIPGGSKRSPRMQPKLSPEQLERYNGIEKTPPRLATIVALPETSLPEQEYNGFVRGSIGMFFTPQVDAGMRFTPGDFHLNLIGGATYSQGHRTNADFMRGYAEISSRYTAPKKFFFFGGSVTESWIKFRTQSYKLFAVGDSAPQRTWTDISAGIATSGSYENIHFEMGTSVQGMMIAQDTSNLPTRSGQILRTTGQQTAWLLKGHLGANTLIAPDTRLGLRMNALLQTAQWRLPLSWQPSLFPFTSIAVNETHPLIEALATFSVQKDGYSIDASAGYQFIRDSRYLTQERLGLAGELPSTSYITMNLSGEVRFSPLVSLRIRAHRGAEHTMQTDIMQANPYSSLADAGWVASIVNINLQSDLVLHPSRTLDITMGGGYKTYQQYAFPGANSIIIAGSPSTPPATFQTGEFSTRFVLQPTILQIRTSLLWKFSPDDAFSTSLLYQKSSVPTITSSPALPFLPDITVNADYRREWSDQFSTMVSFQYISERAGTAPLLTQNPINISLLQLPSFADLRLSATWKLKPSVHLFVRGENLLNQTIFLWDGYQERGIFGTVGVQILW
jgi:hypothetical protein